MRKLVVVGAVLLTACSSPTDDQGQAQPLPTVAPATTAATTTTETTHDHAAGHHPADQARGRQVLRRDEGGRVVL
jgi:uncharacterized lipoprotein YmbA